MFARRISLPLCHPRALAFALIRPYSVRKLSSAQRPSFPPADSFKITQTPHPSWKAGDKQPYEHNDQLPTSESTKTFISSEMNGSLRYRLLINGVAPRPIALVSSQNPQGTVNLAPFSYFNAVAHDPPSLMISVARTNKGNKDTAKNILDTKEFVVNIISDWFVEAANYCAIDAPSTESELDLAGLTSVPSTLVRPPRVAESAFAMECTLLHHYPLQDAQQNVTHDIIIGHIRAWHVRKEVLAEESGRIDYSKYRPISRLGGVMYGSLGAAFEIPRPEWEEEKDKFKRSEPQG